MGTLVGMLQKCGLYFGKSRLRSCVAGRFPCNARVPGFWTISSTASIQTVMQLNSWKMPSNSLLYLWGRNTDPLLYLWGRNTGAVSCGVHRDRPSYCHPDVNDGSHVFTSLMEQPQRMNCSLFLNSKVVALSDISVAQFLCMKNSKLKQQWH